MNAKRLRERGQNKGWKARDKEKQRQRDKRE